MNIITTPITLSQNVVFQALENESVLLDMNTEKYFTLDGLGTDIWMLLAEKTPPAEILEQLYAKYDVGKEQLENDLSRFLDTLQDARLIVEET